MENNEGLGQAIEIMMARKVHGTTILATWGGPLHRSACAKVKRAVASGHRARSASNGGDSEISTNRTSGRKRD
ncbi:hypothetical protein PIB30_082875, partial [Stylosanthes scabra]|nr:hypothetical protein [Stylosanthes scabra]